MSHAQTFCKLQRLAQISTSAHSSRILVYAFAFAFTFMQLGLTLILCPFSHPQHQQEARHSCCQISQLHADSFVLFSRTYKQPERSPTVFRKLCSMPVEYCLSKMYIMPALLYLTASSAACRFTGRAIFCEQLLSQAGIPLFVSFKLASGDPEQLANYLKPRLEAAAGGSLDAYCS